MTCTGTSGDSGWKSVSAASRDRRPSASWKPIFPATRSSLAKAASASCHLASTWNSTESRDLSPGKPATRSASANARAHSGGVRAAKRSLRRNFASCARRSARIGARGMCGAPRWPTSRSRPSAVPARLRSCASSRARAAISASLPARKGERRSRLASSKASSRPASSSRSSASRARANSASDWPRESPKARGGAPAPGALNPGCRVAANTRSTTRRDCARSGTTTPMRGARPPAAASSRARAQRAAAAISSDGEARARRTGVPACRGGSHASTSVPAFAAASSRSRICGVSRSKA